MKNKKKNNSNWLYLLPVLAVVGYLAGQFIKKNFFDEAAKIETQVFPIVRENISEDLRLVIEPDSVVIHEGTIVVYLKQDNTSSASPEVTKSRDFIKSYLNSKLEEWKSTSEYQDKEIQVMFNDEGI